MKFYFFLSVWFVWALQLDCLQKVQEVGHQLPGNLELLAVRTSRTGETLAHLAAQGGHAQCLDWLLRLEHGNGYTLKVIYVTVDCLVNTSFHLHFQSFTPPGFR